MTEPEAKSQEPSFRNLLDWIEGRVTRSDAGNMEAKVLHGDQETTDTVNWIRGFLRFGKRNPIPRTPPIIRQRLGQSFERHHGRGRDVIHTSAALSFDSRDDVLLAGVRGGFDVDDGYRLAFAADSVGIMIDVIPETDGTVQLDGQVLSVDDEAPVWEARVQSPGGTISSIDGDGEGCFTVERVPLDATALTLTNGLMQIEILRPLGEPGD